MSSETKIVYKYRWQRIIEKICKENNFTLDSYDITEEGLEFAKLYYIIENRCLFFKYKNYDYVARIMWKDKKISIYVIKDTKNKITALAKKIKEKIKDLKEIAIIKDF